MKPPKELKKLLKNSNVSISPEKNDKIFSAAMRAYERRQHERSTRFEPTLRSIILQRRLIKYAMGAVIAVGLLIPLTYGASRIIKKLMIKPDWRDQAVMDFKQDKNIRCDLRIGTKDQPDIIVGRNIRIFAENGQLLGTLRSTTWSWPKYKWRARIDLLDAGGKSLASTEHVRENGGIQYQGHGMGFADTLHFSLGLQDDVLQEPIEYIRVQYEKAPDDVPITPDAWVESSMLDVLHGQVTDADGEPIANAVVQIREKRKRGQVSIAAEDVFTDRQGYYSFDEIRWPYTIGAVVYSQDSSSQKLYHQFKKLNQTLHGTHNIDFGFEAFPHGTAVLSGRIVKRDGSAATEFTIDVTNKIDRDDCADPYLYQFGVKTSFVSADGTFEISGLAPGVSSVDILLTGNEVCDMQVFQVDCELADNKITEVTNEGVEDLAKEFRASMSKGESYYGQVLYENGKPAVPPACPWKGARVFAVLRYADATSTHSGTEMLGYVDPQGCFTAHLTDEQFEKLGAGDYSIEIYHPSYKSEFASYPIATFPAELLTQDRDTLQGYRLSSKVLSREPEDLQSILRSYDMLYELGSVLLCWCDTHEGRFPAGLEWISSDNTETQTWIMDNIEYQGQGRTRLETEPYPVAYDKNLLECLEGTHVLFSDGRVVFLQEKKLEFIEGR